MDKKNRFGNQRSRHMMQNEQIFLLHRAIKAARRQLLDYFQLRYGQTKEWHELRSKILEIFGSDGLERHFSRLGDSQGHGDFETIPPKSRT